MDEDVTALSLHSHEPKIIFHGTGKQTMPMVKPVKLVLMIMLRHLCASFCICVKGDGEEDEVVVELQESVIVSDVEGEKITVHGLGAEELVIQEAIEDVVAEYVPCAEEEEGLATIAVETCVMSPDDVALEDEGLQVDVGQEDPDTCGDYLMISCKI